MSLRLLAATSALTILISLTGTQVQAHSHSAAPAEQGAANITDAHQHTTAIEHGELSLSAPNVRASVPGASVAGGYVTITNNGKEADRLVAASTATADHVEIHEMSMENNVMKMRQLKDGLEIPAGETVELKSGSYHLMLMKPVKPYTEGEKVLVTLDFEKAGKVDVEFSVSPARGGTASNSSHH
ncbi:copper chaperone PCu(A)C [Brucellaceae bacterium C25G]